MNFTDVSILLSSWVYRLSIWCFLYSEKDFELPTYRSDGKRSIQIVIIIVFQGLHGTGYVAIHNDLKITKMGQQLLQFNDFKTN